MIRPNQPTRGAGLAIADLRHPAEQSRLIAAIIACAGLGALAVVLLARGFERESVILTLAIGGVVVPLGWAGLQVHRADLLGNAVRVTPDSLPELDVALRRVCDRLGYRGRIDVYVGDRVAGLIELRSLFGTRVIHIEGDLAAKLLTRERRTELEFLLARFVGALKARHERLTPVRIAIGAAKPIGLINPLLWPYERAVVMSGDQIGLACCGDLQAALHALDRLMAGGELGPHVRDAGLLQQAVEVRRRRLARAAQLVSGTPHLTNRYANLLRFAQEHMPDQWRQAIAEMDGVDPNQITDARPERSDWRRARLWCLPVAAVVLGVLVVGAAATVLPVAGDGDSPEASPFETRHRALQTHVPDSFAASCVAADQVQPQLRPRLAASLVCTAAAPPDVEYFHYADERATAAAFREVTRVAGPGVSDCDTGGRPGPYRIGDAGRIIGQRACWTTKDGRAVIVWTDDAKRILSLATAKDLHIGALLRWWTADSGPD